MPPRRLLLAAACLVLSACASGGPVANPVTTTTPTGDSVAPPAGTASGTFMPVRIPVAGSPPQTGRPWYLAVGDSITFGFSLDPARAGVNSSWALQLQGLLAASGRDWSLYDTACPAETTTTYYTRCPDRAFVPFLAAQSQHDAVTSALRDHGADLRAVFVALGSNDLLHAERAGMSDVASVSATLRSHLVRIVTEIQRAAPRVPVIICNYYDPLANARPTTVFQLAVVNGMLQRLAADLGLRIADFHAAVNGPASPDPDLCLWVDCAHLDIHPTVAGQARLARAALAALG